MIRTVLMRSMQEDSDLDLACCSSIKWSSCSLEHFRMIPANTLSVAGSIKITLKLSFKASVTFRNLNYALLSFPKKDPSLPGIRISGNRAFSQNMGAAMNIFTGRSRNKTTLFYLEEQSVLACYGIWLYMVHSKNKGTDLKNAANLLTILLV